MKVINNSEIEDIRLSWASTVFFIGSALNSTLKSVSFVPGAIIQYSSLITGVVILSFFIANFGVVKRRNNSLLIKLYFVFFVVYFISAFLITLRGEPLNVMLRYNAFITFLWWIPTGVCACSVCDRKILYSIWLKASYIIAFICFILFFFHNPSDNESLGEYNMSFGIYLIVPLLFHISNFIEKKKFYLLALPIIEVLGLLVYANRGVLLSLVFFVVYKFAFESKNKIKKILSFIFLIVCIIGFSASLQSMASFLVNLGIESRTLWMLSEGVISDTTGREEIWKTCFEMIKMRPILGWGLGGENYYLAFSENGSLVDDVNTYTSHNGIIQNFVSFGVIIGLIVNLIILIPFFHLNKKEKYYHELLLIFASASVIPSCISASGFFIKPGVAIFLLLYYFPIKMVYDNHSHNH